MTPFTIVKTSNYGTSHPVVARLLVQTKDLLQWADLPEAQRENVWGVYYAMKERLLKCHEVYGRLSTTLKAAMEEMQPAQENSRVVQVPHLIGLQGECETFLYEAKNFLRDLLGVVNIFFGTAFEEASALYDPKNQGKGEMVGWARTKFGATDPFTEMLISEHGWIEDLIRKRNAVEHPGGKSGRLHIQNFTRMADGKFLMPTWHRDQGTPTGIFPDLETYLDNMLTLAEDMLISCIVHNTKFKLIQFGQIPEKDRNTECPVRIRVQLNEDLVKPREAVP